MDEGDRVEADKLADGPTSTARLRSARTCSFAQASWKATHEDAIIPSRRVVEEDISYLIRHLEEYAEVDARETKFSVRGRNHLRHP